jgi:hypothetical protein
MTIVKDKPELADWWREMEQKYENHIAEGLPKDAKLPYRFFRGNMTIDEVIEESNLPFEPAKDESKTIADARQMSLWDDWLDSNGGCSESCEVF